MKFTVLGWVGVVGAMVLAPIRSVAYWQNLLADEFSDSASMWTYAGVSNSANEPLIRLDGAAQNVYAEWDQSNVFSGLGDPYTIVSSCLSRPLEHSVTDNDTFRFDVTLNIKTGSVVNTYEIFQIANVALCDVGQMGPDRPMSDNWSGNTTLLKDGSDFLEFNYFINNAWGGPNVTVVMGAHITGVEGEYTTGTNYLQTAMGEGHWLPEGTNLHIRVEYFGSATGTLARTAHGAIYTDPAFSNVLSVNGVAMSYWTQPLPADKSFQLTHLAFYNYPSANWGGANGAGAGTFDDARVEQFYAEGEIFSTTFAGMNVITAWAAESGRTYRVESAANLAQNLWITNATIEALGETASFTNAASGNGAYYRVTH